LPAEYDAEPDWSTTRFEEQHEPREPIAKWLISGRSVVVDNELVMEQNGGMARRCAQSPSHQNYTFIYLDISVQVAELHGGLFSTMRAELALLTVLADDS
jgi:hypothetical protein